MNVGPQYTGQVSSFTRDSFAVFVGGGVGACLRYTVSLVAPHLISGPLPQHYLFLLPTLLINTLGAFLLGLLLAYLAARGPETARRRSLRLSLGTGLLGGFTTYSTFALDGVQLFLDQRWVLACSYLTLSLAGGLLFAMAGLRVGQKMGARA